MKKTEYPREVVVMNPGDHTFFVKYCKKMGVGKSSMFNLFVKALREGTIEFKPEDLK